jgi:hypothetical protein
MVKTDATFADAAAEYLRYVEQVRQLEAVVGPDDIDAYKERLIAEGGCPTA